jgi:copper transport protein
VALRRRDVGAGVLACAWLVPALIVPPSAGAHAGVTGTVAFVADVAHVSAAAVWTGGLAFLALALLLSRADRWQLATRAVPRFSTLAVAAVGVLVVAGAVNGYIQVKSWASLFGTTYGWLLLAKIGLVLPLIALGAYNNMFAVPRLKAGIASAFEQRRFLRAVGVELALMMTVVGVTAVLVAESPARGTIVVAPVGPYASTTALGPLSLSVRVDPARSGSNLIDIRLYDRAGKPARVSAATIAASLPSEKLGPLRFTAHKLGVGHYAVHGANLTLAGKWKLEIAARRSEFDELTRTLSVPIGGTTLGSATGN